MLNFLSFKYYTKIKFNIFTALRKLVILSRLKISGRSHFFKNVNNELDNSKFSSDNMIRATACKGA